MTKEPVDIATIVAMILEPTTTLTRIWMASKLILQSVKENNNNNLGAGYLLEQLTRCTKWPESSRWSGAKQQNTCLKKLKFGLSLKEKHRWDDRFQGSPPPGGRALRPLRRSHAWWPCSVDPRTLSPQPEHHHAPAFYPVNSLIVFPPYAPTTIGFVAYKSISSAQGDLALRCHLVQALLFPVFTFFLHPISFPLPSPVSAPFGSSSLLSYIQSSSHFLYPCSINNWWTIFDLLGVIKGQT